MKKIVLISCSRTKQDKKAKACELYVSPLFQNNLKFSKLINPDQIYILSARYGLLDLNKEIGPYDQSLNNMPAFERKDWAKKVISQLEKIADLEKDKFIFLAGEKYSEYLIPYLKNHETPLEGMGIGQQLHFLKSINSQRSTC